MRYIDFEGIIQETYLDLLNLERKTSDYIFASIKNFFMDLKIWEKVIFISTDGENSMAG